MTTPNISEAARRAAEQEIDEFHYRHRITQPRHPFESGHYVQAALDSAHPAPKEGHAELKEFWLRSIPSGLSESGRDQVAAQIATMQLELAEKTREVEALRERAELDQTTAAENTESDHKTMGDLRTHLQKANELLGEASDSLYAAYSEIGLFLGSCSAKEIKDSFSGLDKTADRVERTRNRIATHLNQQSK